MQKLATVFYVRSQGEGWVLDAGRWTMAFLCNTFEDTVYLFRSFSAMNKKCNTLSSKERMATALMLAVGCIGLC